MKKHGITIALILSLLVLAGCTYVYDNVTDRGAENYQGYTTVTTVDEVTADHPLEGETLTWCEFKASKVLDNGADLYGLQVAASATGFGETPDITSASNEINASSMNLTEGSWCYRVAARDAGGTWGDWSTAVSFAANSGVDEAVLSPTDGGFTPDTTPALDWPDIAEAASYEIEYATTEAALDGSGAVPTDSSGYQIPVTDTFSYGDTCYWRVRGVNEDGIAGVWSGVFEVEIREPEIGETFEGGIVFYLDGSGGGLVCAESDQSTDIEWGGSGTDIGGDDLSSAPELDGVGDGLENTEAIVDALGTNGGTPYAAKFCYDLSLNGYTDWFLPSKDELDLMYENLHLPGLGAFGSGYYWSSSESYSRGAWSQDFGSGDQLDAGNKDDESRVRAVRAFSY